MDDKTPARAELHRSLLMVQTGPDLRVGRLGASPGASTKMGPPPNSENHFSTNAQKYLNRFIKKHVLM